MIEIITAACGGFLAGWLVGRLDRDTQDDWRRRFNHENRNRPSGPPPLKLRRREPDPPEQFIRMDEGRVQRGNANGGPTMLKPPLKPQPQGGRLIRLDQKPLLPFDS